MVDGLHLNGTWMNRRALLEQGRAKSSERNTPAWEIAFWCFLSAWFNDEGVISVQSSGSTGPPKTLFIPKRFCRNSAKMTLDFLRIRPGDRALLCLSPQYIAGKMMIVRALIGGLNLTVIAPQVSAILKHNEVCDFSAMVPTQIQNLLQTPEGRQKIRTIGTLLIGGSPFSREIEEQLQEFNNRIYAPYGMTETVSHIALRRLNGPVRSRCYQTLAGVSIRTDGNDCLVIDAPALCDTTIHTRDLVGLGGPDQLEAIGRLDHVINSGGIKYFPEAIEEKLSPIVTDRFIISSLPDSGLGEKVILIIEANNPQQYRDEQFETRLKARLTPYEVPKMVLFLKKFPVVGHDRPARKTIAEEALTQLFG
ncbi:MAG TPA: AMP-binding protein [Syntrophales bacterium]|nr:AMP-binding protein [Syntrophales bacterium]